MNYLLVYDVFKSKRKTSYTIYSINIKDGKYKAKIKLKGSMLNKKIKSSKFDQYSTHFILDSKPLNESQSLLFERSSNTMYVFDHLNGKLKILYKFSGKRDIQLTKLEPSNPLNYFHVSEENIVSSNIHKIIILREDHYDSKEFILLKYENGKFYEEIKYFPMNIYQLFSIGSPIKIEF
ncbi:MAG: hypothetical protein SFU98_21275 [Leptospiraceae bacterium]|nr:hypothetical protein [Leptospiraceae bacterium]